MLSTCLVQEMGLPPARQDRASEQPVSSFAAEDGGSGYKTAPEASLPIGTNVNSSPLGNIFRVNLLPLAIACRKSRLLSLLELSLLVIGVRGSASNTVTDGWLAHGSVAQGLRNRLDKDFDDLAGTT